MPSLWVTDQKLRDEQPEQRLHVVYDVVVVLAARPEMVHMWPSREVGSHVVIDVVIIVLRPVHV